MPVYEMQARPAQSTDQTDRIDIEVAIYRDGDLILTRVVHYSSSVDNTAIRDDIIAKAREFADMDAGHIAQELTNEREAALAESLSGVQYDPDA